PRNPLDFLRTFLWRARAVTPRLTLGMARSSTRVRQHHADGPLVAVVNVGGAAQLALRLRRLLGQNVALERLRALDRAAGADLEPLGGRFLRLHLGHSIAPVNYPAAAGFVSSFFGPFTGTTFFFGASTITICRPSSRGNCSMIAIGSRSFLTRSSSRTPNSWCAISRPRKRKVTFALSPSSRNCTSLPTLIL